MMLRRRQRLWAGPPDSWSFPRCFMQRGTSRLSPSVVRPCDTAFEWLLTRRSCRCPPEGGAHGAEGGGEGQED